MTTTANESTTVKVETERMPAVNGESTRPVTIIRPEVDVVETEQELLLLADVPGARAEDIDVRFERGVLTLRARVASHDDTRARPLAREFTTGDYQRTFQVGEAIDASGIDAETRDGVLIVHLPKVEAARPRRIEVRAAP